MVDAASRVAFHSFCAASGDTTQSLADDGYYLVACFVFPIGSFSPEERRGSDAVQERSNLKADRVLTLIHNSSEHFTAAGVSVLLALSLAQDNHARSGNVFEER